MKTIIRLVILLYICAGLLLFLYSYTQVDLGLTLSRFSLWQSIQKTFQFVGYFNRPLSTQYYITIISLLYVFYGIFLFLAHQKKITKKAVWIVVIALSLILNFSYNAFSYDLFNYIFDAKIYTYYGHNPYFQKAEDYAAYGEPMLGFMQWTHRMYPYGPVWLFLTIPLSYLGFQFFLPTLFLFKFLMTLSFLGSVYMIGRILQKTSPQNELVGIVLFGLNPLVLIESVVSAHNDIVMMFFALCALLFLIEKRYIFSAVLLLFSIGIKFATVFLIPVFLLIYFLQKTKKSLEWQSLFLLCASVMMYPILLASIRTNFQPWYILYVLPFAALIPKKYFVVVPFIFISLFSLLRYIPFLYRGNWNAPVPFILFVITFSSIVVSICIVGMIFIAIHMLKYKRL